MKRLKTRYIKSLLVTTLLLANCVIMTPPSLPNPLVSSCFSVNAIARKLKKQNPNSSLNVRKISTSEYWRNAPKGVLLDISTINVGTTPDFELAYSKQIISQCAGIVAVRFTMYGADSGQAYGLVKGRVKRFECPGGQTVANHPFKWGYECLP